MDRVVITWRQGHDTHVRSLNSEHWSCNLFLSLFLSLPLHSCFYSKRLRHWMAFYLVMCR